MVPDGHPPTGLDSMRDISVIELLQLLDKSFAELERAIFDVRL
jgi:hypothetical protein